MEAHPNALGARISDTGQIALHFAASFGHVRMVEELVGLMEPQYLEKVDVGGFTPLAAAACNSGHLRIAQCMVNKNCNILAIPIKDRNLLPVTLALSHGHNEMGHYLYSLTPLELLKAENRIQGVRLLYWCFRMGELGASLLSKFISKAYNMLAREGNAEFVVVELSKASPPLIQRSTDNLWSIFFYAIACRQAELSLFQEEIIRLWVPYVYGEKAIYTFLDIRCLVIVFFCNFCANVSRDPYLTICRRRFPHILAYKVNYRAFYTFLSIATMMIAFSSTILLMLQQASHSWVYLPIIILASVPVTLFVLLQFPLLVQMISSTYGPGMFKEM
ncbi:ankyrin repeat-containing protein NPR4-like isoform X1 [Senna tora]|uniref:Ankyrin repeat-containing protein NPR4-like isoform X1 n=1 Tax=Senna tora TaxID=362788 RepID=A0A834W1Q3_9FABA|nr:ankyrin repeat-containing protein NPR4-like isoform X1 [Senna tora]